MAEDLGDRTELPTARRLEEARAKGQVAKSTDLTGAIDLIGAMVAIAAFGGWVATQMVGTMRGIMQSLHEGVAVESAAPALSLAMQSVGKSLLPILLLLAAIAAIAHIVQVGLRFSTQTLSLKWGKLNPWSGVQQLVGRRNIVRTGVSILKCVLILGVAYLVIGGLVAKMAGLPVLTTLGAYQVIGDSARRLAMWLLAVLLALGIVDFMYQKWQYTQDLKMTKADVKDERRSMEGDPQIKSARFKMAQKIAMQRINSAVPKADVVVTNPTHYSVAIQYDATRMRAPKVVAKGVDFLAMRIREVALVHGVPMVERPPLARALYAGVEVGQEVREEHYQAVAEILAYVYRLEEQARAGEAVGA